MEKQTYDFQWLRAGLQKRMANYSNVICFETGDPFRLSQLKAFVIGLPSHTESDIYYLSGWAGLCRIRREDGTPEPVTRGVTGGYDAGVQNSVSEIRDALLYMDNILKTQKVILILHDLEPVQEHDKERDLVRAVRDWSYDGKIFLSESIVFLLSTQVSRLLDPATLDRVAVIQPPMAGTEERTAIIRDQHRKLKGEPQERLVNLLVQATAGLNLHQIKTLLLESYQTTRDFPVEKIKELKSEIIKRSDKVELEEPDPAGFNSVGGYEAVKHFVRNNIIRALQEPDRARKMKAKIPRGIILFGPPGTGKTLFARALAREIHLPFINLRTENLYSELLGASGRNFKEAINLIEQMSPAITFIDEIDRLGKRRGQATDGASEETRRVFNQILEWLGKKERKSIIIGTTNRPDDLDEAFRVGRIDYWIPFLYPNKAARGQILKIHLAGAAIEEKVLEAIAERTDGYSGAELEELVNRAGRIAFAGPKDALSPDDLLQALAAFRIDMEERGRQRDQYIQMAQAFTNDLEFLKELARER